MFFLLKKNNFNSNSAFQIGFCFVCALGHGIKYLKITTDPVELWAAPNSRSRVEREFFDSNFEPFYRVEQIIIKSNYPNITHRTSNGPIEFGPAFDKNFLLEIFELQNSIKSELHTYVFLCV